MFMRERPKHLEKAVADPRNEEPASPLRWETALKDQAERVAALRRALLAPADTTQGRGKERSMGRWGPGASASSLGFQDVIAPRSEEQDLSRYASCCPRRFWT